MLEADDVLGICGSAPNHNVIMVSDDKDLKSVPAKLYRPMSQRVSRYPRPMLTGSSSNKR